MSPGVQTKIRRGRRAPNDEAMPVLRFQLLLRNEGANREKRQFLLYHVVMIILHFECEDKA